MSLWLLPGCSVTWRLHCLWLKRRGIILDVVFNGIQACSRYALLLQVQQELCRGRVAEVLVVSLDHSDLNVVQSMAGTLTSMASYAPLARQAVQAGALQQLLNVLARLEQQQASQRPEEDILLSLSQAMYNCLWHSDTGAMNFQDQLVALMQRVRSQTDRTACYCVLKKCCDMIRS